MSAKGRKSTRKAIDSDDARGDHHDASSEIFGKHAHAAVFNPLGVVDNLESEFAKLVNQALSAAEHSTERGRTSSIDASADADFLSVLLHGLQKSVFTELRRHCGPSSELSGGIASTAAEGAWDEFEHPAFRGSEGRGLLAEETSAAATLGSPLPPVDANLARKVGEAEREHARLAAEVKAARKRGGEVLAAHAAIYDTRLQKAVKAVAPVLRAHEHSLAAASSSEAVVAGSGAAAVGGAGAPAGRVLVPASSKGRALAAALDASQASADAAAAAAATDSGAGASSSGGGAATGAAVAPRRRSRGSFGAAITNAAAVAARVEPEVLALVVGSRRTRSRTAAASGQAAAADAEPFIADLPGEAEAAAIEASAASARRNTLASAASSAPALAATISQQRPRIAKVKKDVVQAHAVAHMEMEKGPATAAFDAVLAGTR